MSPQRYIFDKAQKITKQHKTKNQLVNTIHSTFVSILFLKIFDF